MINVQVLDNIAQEGLSLFDVERYHLDSAVQDPEVILVRSHSLHNREFAMNLRAVGRAGAGTDNIPVDKLTDLGIPVFFSPGANANAVKELVIAAILIGYRHLDAARRFLEQTVEASAPTLNKTIETEKKKFVGNEIAGKTLGVVGLGNIGVKVANAALGLGMKVIAYDSNISVTNALALMPSVERVMDLNTLYQSADIITLHVPLNSQTTHFINQENIRLLKQNALLLNFSREPVVSEEAVLQQLHDQKLMGYITDFPTAKLAAHPNVLSFPHLGASTVEAEQNSAKMVVRNICNYLEYGIIEHSVNFPNIALPSQSLENRHRLIVINRNIPGAIGGFAQVISKLGLNIEQMVNTSQDKIAINLIDVSGNIRGAQEITAAFKEIPSVIHAYVLANLIL